MFTMHVFATTVISDCRILFMEACLGRRTSLLSAYRFVHLTHVCLTRVYLTHVHFTVCIVPVSIRILGSGGGFSIFCTHLHIVHAVALGQSDSRIRAAWGRGAHRIDTIHVGTCMDTCGCLRSRFMRGYVCT